MSQVAAIPALRFAARRVVEAVAIAAAMACGPEPPPVILKPSEFMGDRWDQIPPTPEWKHVTRTVPEGDRSEACKTVVGSLQVELSCHSVLCTPGRDLAEEWLQRCPPHTPELESQVAGMKMQLTRRVSEPPTECAQKAAILLRDGCGPDEQCLGTVQRWMTQCRESDATPVVIAKLEQVVARVVGPDAPAIDTRTCDELKVEFDKAAKCVHKVRCDEAISRAEAYVERCLPERRPPPAAVALTWLTAIAGAQRTVVPVAVEEAKIDVTMHPLAFADGRGAALRVCEERVDNLAEYLDAREACVGGLIRLARIFEGDGGRRLTIGALGFPDDEIFQDRFPSLLLAGEQDARDAQAMPAFEKRLAEVVQMSEAGRKAEGAKALGELLCDHNRSLARTEGAPKGLWTALIQRDAALAPLFEELGRAKMQKVRGGLAADKVVGFARRSLERPLADVRWDGVLEVGAPSPGAKIDFARLPQAMGRYHEALSGAKALVAAARVTADDQERAAADAKGRAEACGAAESLRKKTEDGLIACGFGVASCDAPKVDSLAAQNDDARRTLDASRLALEILLSGPAHGARKEVMAAIEAAGCPKVQ